MKVCKPSQRVVFFLLVLVPLVLAVSCDALFGDWDSPFFGGLNNPNDPYVSASPAASGTASPSPTASAVPGTAGAIGFETPGLTGWTGSWIRTTESANTGSYSLRSNVISHSAVTNMDYSAEYRRDGTISFSYRVSSESGCDFLKFYIDNVQQTSASWSGTVSWTTASFPVTTGPHTFRWAYSKDGSISSGSDCAWIDDVSLDGLTPITTGDGDITVEPAAEPGLTVSITGGQESVAQGTVLNLVANSPLTVDSWEWYLGTTLVDSDGTYALDTTGLRAGQYYTVTLVGYTANDLASVRFSFKVE